MNFNSKESAILSLIRRSLFESEEPLPTLQENEWEELVCTSDALGVLPLAFEGASAIAPSALPKYLPDAWSELVYRKSERSEAILAEESALADFLKEQRTPILFLADTAAAAYYPTPALRTVKRIDCLCDRRIKEVAETLSLTQPLSEKQALIVDKNGDMEVMRLRSMLARALDSCINSEIGTYTLPVPSASVQALLILLAAEQKASLLLLLDFAVLLHYGFAKQEINLAMQVRSWEQCGLIDTAKKLAMAASLSFGLEIEEWFEDIDKEEAAEWLSTLLTPTEAKLSQAKKNLDIAMKRVSQPPKVQKVQKVKKTADEKSALSRFFGLFAKK